MNCASEAVLSNRVEKLYEELKSNLWTDLDGSLFKQRWIIVPSQAMKSWLQFRLAQDPDCEIAMGIEIDLLDRMISKLSREIAPTSEKQPPIYPNETELALAFETEIQRTSSSYPSMHPDTQSIWKPLLQYLKAFNGSIPKQSEKRLLALCENLAGLFLQYGRYGCGILEEWETTESTNWQGALWKTLKERIPSIQFPSQALDRLNGISISPQSNAFLNNLDIHIFAISFLPQRVLNFLERLADKCPIRYYLLSPCQMYWSDCQSDRDKHRLLRYWKNRGVSESQQETLEEILRDSNPLLGNFGRMGREMASQIEEASLVCHESYQVASGITAYSQYADSIGDEVVEGKPAPLTLLQAVQADMALLRSVDSNNPIELPERDNSIQLHMALTKQREVEILYNNLADLLCLHADDASPLTPSDIIVMVPEFRKYEPAIIAVFGGKDSCIDFQMMDLSCASNGSLIQDYLHLLDLVEGRWCASDLLRLLTSPTFLKKQQFSKNDVRQIEEWIQSSGVHWGQNSSHRQTALERDHGPCEEIDASMKGTWDHSHRRLLTGLTVEMSILDEIDMDIMPAQSMESSQTPLLSRWLQLIDSLQADLNGLCTEMRASEWSRYLACLLEAYFYIDRNDRELTDQLHQLEDTFATITKSERIVSDSLYTFKSIKSRLMQSLNANTSKYRERHLQAVRFCPLLPMRALPARVIAVLGLQDGVFPRRDRNFSLNQLFKHPKADYFPTLTDFDRYLFLETLLSAREVLLLSYVGYCYETQSTVAPSIAVQELFNYMDEGYEIGGKKPSLHCSKKHPIDAFAREYFLADAVSKSYRQNDYRNAVKSLNANKTPHVFLKEFPNRLSETRIQFNYPLILDIHALSKFAVNPLKVYLNTQHGIYLNDEDEIQDHEPFAFTHLKKRELEKLAIKKSVQAALINADKQGALPKGLFKEIAISSIESSIDAIHEKLGIAENQQVQFFNVSFAEHMKEPDLKNQNHWLLPSLQIMNSNGQTISLTGTLENMTHGGLFVFGDNSYRNIAKIWPSYLVLLLAVERYHLPIKTQILTSKMSKPLVPIIEDCENLLWSFCEYYLDGLQNPSPIIPEWIEPFVDGDADALSKCMRAPYDDPFSTFYNSYVLWLFREPGNLPDAHMLIGEWSQLASKIYGPIKAKKKVKDAVI